MSNKWKHDPNVLCQRFYSQAKWRWGASLACKVIVILVGASAVWFSVLSKATPFLIFVLSIISEWFVWRSDKDKGVAESLRRKLDFRDSLGWQIPKADVSDILARTSFSFRSKLPPEDEERGQYFASRDEHVPTRAMKNIQEAAWWNKHLAEKMSRYTFLATLLGIVASVSVLIVSVSTVNDFDTLSNIGRAATSVLMIVLSMGLIRLALAYSEFTRKSQRVEERTIEYLKNEITDLDAHKLYNEYHLDRASAPMVPDFIYELHKDHLNEIWEDYRAD